MTKTTTGISRREFLQAASFGLGAMAMTPNLARVLDINALAQAAKREGVIGTTPKANTVSNKVAVAKRSSTKAKLATAKQPGSKP